MNLPEIASQMRTEADRLMKAADLIAPRQLQSVAPTPIHNRTKQRTGRRKLSAETRRKLSEAQQRRRERERAMTGVQQAA